MKSWLVSLSLVSFCVASPSVAFGQTQQQKMWQQQQAARQQQQAMWQQQQAQQQLQQQRNAAQTGNAAKANSGYQQSKVPVAKTGATSQANTYGYPRPEGYAWLTGTTVNYWVMTPNGPKVNQIKNPSGYDDNHDYRKGQPNLDSPNGGLFQSQHQWTMRYPYTNRQDAFSITPVANRTPVDVSKR